jgi:hydroxymethylbilane synthase
LDGLVGRPDGTLLLKERIDGTLQDAVALGTQLAERLLDQGADDLIGNDTASS